jgi:hypothetical protein
MVRRGDLQGLGAETDGNKEGGRCGCWMVRRPDGGVGHSEGGEGCAGGGQVWVLGWLWSLQVTLMH